MASSRSYKDSDIVIVSAVRTPVGTLNGDLSSLQAHELGTIVIKDVLTRSGVSPCDVSEVILGQVYTAGLWDILLVFHIFFHFLPVLVILYCSLICVV